jgi:hypothetical protein
MYTLNFKFLNDGFFEIHLIILSIILEKQISYIQV